MDTREKILIAAAEEFSDNGYLRATMRGISRRAGINHAGINYHFRSKEELYKEVFAYLTEMTEHYSLPRREDISNGEEWMNAVYEYVLNILSNISAPNDYMRWKNSIIFKEINKPTEHFPFFYAEYIEPHLEDLRYYVSLGLPRACRDQVDFYVLSVISQCVFYEQNRAFVEIVTGPEFFDKSNLERMAAHVTQNLCGRLSFGNAKRKNEK